MNSLATILQSEKRYAEAEKLRRIVLEVQRSVLGPEHPSTLSTMSDLANTLSVEERYKEADALLREALAIQSRTLGPNHPDAADTKYNLACNAALGGHRKESLAWLRDAIAHGLSPITSSHMAEDSDLKSLHGDPEFEAMVVAAKAQVVQAKKSDAKN